MSGSGRYVVSATDYGWTFAGTIPGRIDDVGISSGDDPLGSWQEIAFDHEPNRSSAIRLYDARSIVLFTTQYGEAGANVSPFPHFTSFPQGLHTFSFEGLWSYSFGALNIRSPWLFYDEQANSFLFTPAANFMTAVTRLASDGAMEAAIDSRIDTFPAGFTHRAMLAFGSGVNAAFESWGKVLTGLSGKNRPANDANTLLNHLSYWTDAGAAYYYHPYKASEYVPVLDQLPQEFERFSTPIGSIELDSWHYPKGTPPSWADNGSGMDTFQADPSIFPNGLAAFQQSLGLPLITHARWIDTNSPLRSKYRISNNVAVDPQYWKDNATYLSTNGVGYFEQDWLSGPANTDFNLTDPDAFMDNMASAMQTAGLKIVYCMPTPSHIMQSSKYDNVIAARMSPDAFQRERWDTLLFNSRIATAVGVWPFPDAFMSRNEKDVLVATLMAGPIGSGDAIGAGNEPNLRRAVRTDGVIVKPDVSLTPLDQTFVAHAQSDSAPVVASTYTEHAGRRTAYILAYSRVAATFSQIAFSPASIGVAGRAYVYDFFNHTGMLIQPGGAFSALVDYSGFYYLVAPIGPSGMAFLGDAGKFVSCGKKRIEQLSDDGRLHVLIRFAPGEKLVALRLYSPAQPVVSAESGSVGDVQNRGNNIYRLIVSPDANGVAAINFSVASGSSA